MKGKKVSCWWSLFGVSDREECPRLELYIRKMHVRAEICTIIESKHHAVTFTEWKIPPWTILHNIFLEGVSVVFYKSSLRLLLESLFFFDSELSMRSERTGNFESCIHWISVCQVTGLLPFPCSHCRLFLSIIFILLPLLSSRRRIAKSS